MDEQTKRTACRMIAGLVAADDDFSESERRFLDKVLERFDIPESEWDAIFPLLEYDEAEAAIRTLAPDAQRETFLLLLDAARVDGVISVDERKYLELIGHAIGMSDSDLANLA
jgi:hypothetical protein